MTETAKSPNYVEIKRMLSDGLRFLQNHGRGDPLFDPRDAKWGGDMAMSDASFWSPKTTFHAYRFLRKYAETLKAFNIDLAIIPEMDSPEDAMIIKDNFVRAHRPSMTKPRIKKIAPAAYRLEFFQNYQITEALKVVIPLLHRQFVKDDTGPHWIVRIDQAEIAVKFMEFAARFKFEVEPEAAAILGAMVEAHKIAQEKEMKMVLLSTATDGAIEVPNIAEPLLPFQRAGVEYATLAERTFIADEMGLGKTVQALAAVEISQAFPCLIICRVNLKRNWQRQIHQFFPFRQLSMGIGSGGDYLIITHHELKTNQDILKDRDLMKFPAVVIDECHDFKHIGAQRTKALLNVSDGQQSKFVFMLSGTPLTNRPNELKVQLRILRRIDDFGGSKWFQEIYCGKNAFLNAERLNKKMRAICYVRRKKLDVLKDLPDKRREEVEIDLDNRQEYDAAVIRVRERIKDLQEKAAGRKLEAKEMMEGLNLAQLLEWTSILSPSLPLRQTVEWESEGNIRAVQEHIIGVFARKEEFVENAAAIMMLNDLKRTAAKGKLNGFIEWANNFSEDSEEKMVVFAHHADIQEALAQRLEGAIWTRDKSRFRTPQDAVDHFASNDKARFLVCSLRGDSVGLNGMQKVASHVAHLEFDWVFATHEQAEDRLHRIGQHDSVNSYYVKAPGSVDEDLLEILMDKKALCEAVADGKTVKQQKSALQRVIEGFLK